MEKNSKSAGVSKPEQTTKTGSNPAQSTKTGISPVESVKAGANPVQTKDAGNPAIDNLQKELDKRLAQLMRQKTLADHRTVFLANREALIDALHDVQGEGVNKQFESGTFRLKLVERPGYSDKDRFGISNPDLIAKFIQLLVEEIDVKVREIENELLKA